MRVDLRSDYMTEAEIQRLIEGDPVAHLAIHWAVCRSACWLYRRGGISHTRLREILALEVAGLLRTRKEMAK